MARRRRGRTLLVMAAGAAAQYFMDRERGPGRRARMREQMNSGLQRFNRRGGSADTTPTGVSSTELTTTATTETSVGSPDLTGPRAVPTASPDGVDATPTPPATGPTTP